MKMMAIYFCVSFFYCSLMRMVKLACTPGYNVNYDLNAIWCITNAYGIINVKQAHTSLHTISFLASLQYFFQLHLSRKVQAFEAAVKVVQTGKYLEFVSCQSR